jgi:hypothetical protein
MWLMLMREVVRKVEIGLVSTVVNYAFTGQRRILCTAAAVAQGAITLGRGISVLLAPQSRSLSAHPLRRRFYQHRAGKRR